MSEYEALYLRDIAGKNPVTERIMNRLMTGFAVDPNSTRVNRVLPDHRYPIPNRMDHHFHPTYG